MAVSFFSSSIYSEATRNAIPYSPNMAYTRLGFNYSSSYYDSNEPDQYQVIMDVYVSGSSDRIKRITQKPFYASTPTSTINAIDPSLIFQGEIGYDYNWKVTGSIAPVESAKTFEVKIGEQYGTSPSSSVTVYPNQASASVTILPGTIEPMTNVVPNYYNGPEYWFYTASIASGTNILSNNPEAKTQPDYEDLNYVQANDYHTITVLNADPNLEIGVFDSTDTKIASSSLSVPAFGTIGIGPANLPQFSLDWNDMSRITVLSLGYPNYSIFLPGYLGSGGTLPYSPFRKPACNDEYTRFAFINKYGFWDYYNVYNPVQTNVNLTRELSTRAQLQGSGIYGNSYISTLVQNFHSYTTSKDEYTIQTDYLTQTTATWLEELIESPEVFIQQGSEFVPVVLTNSSYQENEDQARNKLFQYTISWVYANPRRSRI